MQSIDRFAPINRNLVTENIALNTKLIQETIRLNQAQEEISKLYDENEGLRRVVD